MLREIENWHQRNNSPILYFLDIIEHLVCVLLIYVRFFNQGQGDSTTSKAHGLHAASLGFNSQYPIQSPEPWLCTHKSKPWAQFIFQCWGSNPDTHTCKHVVTTEPQLLHLCSVSKIGGHGQQCSRDILGSVLMDEPWQCWKSNQDNRRSGHM